MGPSPIVRAALAGMLATVALLPAASAGVDVPALPAGEGLAIGTVSQRDLEPGEMGRMHAGGIDSIRFYLSWRQVEAERGRYDWSVPDAIVGAASAGGLTALPFLYGSPDWAVAFDGLECEPKCSSYAPASSVTRDAFARFAGAAARRYGPGGDFWSAHPGRPYVPVRAWQVWNEQNSPFFYRPQASASSYALLLGRTAAELRAVDPSAEVVLGGMWGPHATRGGLIPTARYLRDLYRIDGAAESFDGIAVHPYAGHRRGVLEQVQAARTVASEVGDEEAGLWITEIGWASGGRAGEALVKGRHGQARMLHRTFSRFIHRRERWNLRAAYWYAWRDSERGMAVCRWCPQAGLISRAGRAKPSFDALSSLASPPG